MDSNIKNSNIKNSYNMKKIKKFNNIDQMYNQNDLKNLILKSQKIEKPNINLYSLIIICNYLHYNNFILFSTALNNFILYKEIFMSHRGES